MTTERLDLSVLNAIKSVVGPLPVALHEPSFSGNEWLYLKECLDSTFVSSVGKFVDRFEADLALYTGAKHAIAVVNGTAALHIALKLAGVESEHEVLTPALTFVATANAVTYCGAIPHFIDSETTNLGIDLEKLREYLLLNTEQQNASCVNRTSGRVIKAIIPMHAFGHPVDLNGLLDLADQFNLVVVEDAAESLGSFYRGHHTGTFGLLGTLSFNGNKTITTGGGGAILTNNSELARKAKHLTTTAKLPHTWEYCHDQIAYNYRMPNLNAALGCAQLEGLNEALLSKRRLFELYAAAFSDLEGVDLVSEPEHCKSNYWLQTLLLDREHSKSRNKILETTNAAGYMTRPAWTLMHELIPFKNCPRMDLRGATDLSMRLINIPSSSNLGTRTI